VAENALQLPVDPFRLVARIAHGGMATIYVGTSDEGRIAVKLLHPHLAEDAHIGGMFLHEAQLASRLTHPNIVHVIDHGEHPVHGTFIVMEYVEGGDLSTLIEAAQRADQALPIPEILRIGVDLCRGLQAAHTLDSEDGSPLNLIHRDVSPHNLLLGTDGLARLTDFGIAKSDERYTMTSPGQLRGKLAYMAPEQLAHEDELDARVDVFAAGVVIYEALTGVRLFKAEDEISTINKVLLERVAPPSEHRAELAPLDAVILEALAREPEDRWPSAEAFGDALEEAAPALGGLASRGAVEAMVRELLAEHLAKRALKIEAGSLTSSGIFVSNPSGSQAAAEPQRDERSPWLWAMVAVLVLAAGGLGAAIAWSSRAPLPEATVSPIAAPSAVHASAEPAEPLAQSAPQPAAEPAPEANPSPDPAPGAEPTGQATSAAPEEPTAAPAQPVARRRRARPASEAPVRTDRPAPGDDLYPNPFRD